MNMTQIENKVGEQIKKLHHESVLETINELSPEVTTTVWLKERFHVTNQAWHQVGDRIKNNLK